MNNIKALLVRALVALVMCQAYGLTYAVQAQAQAQAVATAGPTGVLLLNAHVKALDEDELNRLPEARTSAQRRCAFDLQGWLVIPSAPCQLWLKFSVYNPLDQILPWAISVQTLHSNDLTLYEATAEGLRRVPMEYSPLSVFNVRLASQRGHTFFLGFAARTHEGISISAQSAAQYAGYSNILLAFCFAVIGMILAASICMLPAFFRPGPRILWHMVFLLSLGLRLAIEMNLCHLWLSEQDTGSHNLLWISGVICVISVGNIARQEFSRFLFMKDRSVLLKWSSWILLMPLVLIFFDYSDWPYYVSRLLWSLLVAPYICVSALLSILHDLKSGHALRALRPFSILFCVVILLSKALSVVGVFDPGSPLMLLVIWLTPVVITLLLTVASEAYLGILEQDRKQSQFELLALRQLNIATLECEVAERTLQFKTEASRADKLRMAQQALLAIISHDLIAPLSGVLSALQRIRVGQHPAAHACLPDIEETVSEVVKRVRYLSTYERRSETGIDVFRRRVSLRNCIDEQQRLYVVAARAKDIRIVNLVPDGHFVYVEPELFGEALGNLIGNAIKFCSAGDCITVSLGNGGEILVADTGPGVAAEQIEDLFIARGHSKQGSAGERGYGLGLSACKSILDLHEASIRYETRAPNGACFCISFARLQPRVAMVCESRDTQDWIDRMGTVFSGMQASPCPSAKCLVEDVRKGRLELPHFICVDVSAGNGLADLEWIRSLEMLDRVSVLAFCGDAPDAAQKQAILDAGAQAVLHRNCTVAELSVAILSTEGGDLLRSLQEQN